MANRLTKGKALVGTLAADVQVTASSAGSFAAGISMGSTAAQHKVLALSLPSSLGTSALDSGGDMPANAIIHDVWVKVTTASSAACTLTVGGLAAEGGTTDGLMRGVSVASTGVFRGTGTVSTTGDIPQITAITRGTHLYVGATGTTGNGYYAPRVHATGSSAIGIGWNVSAATTALVGTVFIEYVQL